MATQPFDIVFVLYDGVTQLDFTGPHQVLWQVPGARLTLASHDGGTIRADSGIVFADVARLGRIARCDMLCVPGGPGTAAAALDQALLAEVTRLATTAQYVTSVCTGSLILGAAGLLRGKRAACHWAWRDLLPLFGATPDAARVVRDGNVITGGGVTAGIDFALTIAAEIAGSDVAQAIQLGIEYAPAPPFDAGRPDTAPAPILERVRTQMRALASERQHAIAEAAQRG